MATTYGPAARKMAMAQMLMRNANQPVHSPWNAISNLANTYMGWKMAGQAGDLQDARKADKQAKLQQSIRAGRGWTNPDDTYYQLTRPFQKGLPVSRQPGARLMRSPKGPMVAGSRQAMADVLMGSGHDDLVTMGMKLDPAFRDPLTSRPGAKIQYHNELNRLIGTYGKDSDEVKRLMQVLRIGQPQLFKMPQGVVRVRPEGDGAAEIVSVAELAPQDRPEHKGAVVTAEGVARTEVKRAEALPTRIQSIESKLINLPFLDRNLQRVKDLAASPTTSGKLGVLTGLDPSSDQFSLNEAVVQFQSLIGLDSLVRLKATGATMGALNKEEMGLLVNKVGSLNTLADPSMLSETLDTVMYLYKKGIRGDQDKFAKEYPNETPTWQLLDVPNPIHNNAIRDANAAIEYQDSQGNDVRDEVRKRLQKKFPNIDLTGLK